MKIQRCTLQSLHREGISIEPLRPELEFLAIDQPCLDFKVRAEIVTILAEISPNDPRWLNMLKFWRAQEDMKYGPADLLIDKFAICDARQDSLNQSKPGQNIWRSRFFVKTPEQMLRTGCLAVAPNACWTP